VVPIRLQVLLAEQDLSESRNIIEEKRYRVERAGQKALPAFLRLGRISKERFRPQISCS
jgi:hypothetical protein